MHRMVRDVMTTEVATAEPGTPFKELVARLIRRPDEEIAGDVPQEVLLRSLWVDPDSVVVDVRDVEDTPVTVPSELLVDRAPGVRRRS